MTVIDYGCLYHVPELTLLLIFFTTTRSLTSPDKAPMVEVRLQGFLPSVGRYAYIHGLYIGGMPSSENPSLTRFSESHFG